MTDKNLADDARKSGAFHKDRFQILLAASHGAGTNACMHYLRKYLDVDCLAYHYLKPEGREEFLKTNPDLRKCIFLDSAVYSTDEYLASLRPQLDDPFLLLHLERDPVERLCSVVNTHIFWWGTSVSGFAHNSPSSTLLYEQGDVNGLLLCLLWHPTMYGSLDVVPKTRPWTGNYLLYDMEALKPARMATTLKEIALRLGLESMTKIDDNISSHTSIYSCKNRFIPIIKPLDLRIRGNTVQLLPCPLEMLEVGHYAVSDIAWRGTKEKSGFEVGDFKGPLTFVFAKNDIDETLKSMIRELLCRDDSSIRQYTADMMKRYRFQELLTKDILVDDTKLVELCKKDSALRSRLMIYLDRHLSFMESIDVNFISDWWKKSITTLQALLDLE